jgi:hypothetical protein
VRFSCDGLSPIDFSNSGQAASLSDASVSGLAVDDAAVYFGGTTGVFSCPINTYCGQYPNQLTDFAATSPLVVKDGVLYFAGASNTVRSCAAAGCGGPASLSPQLEQTHDALRGRLKLTASELASLAHLLESRIDLSLAELLRQASHE